MVLEKNEIIKQIQDFFDKDTVTVVGSGLSCSEGISGMGGLSNKLIKDIPDKLHPEDMECWRKIEQSLIEGNDLETSLQKNKVSEEVEKAIIEVAYNLISREDGEIFRQIIENDRVLKFSDYVSCFNINLYNLVVITTNYDLLIEYAFETKEINYSDSYYGKIVSRYSPQHAEQEMVRGVISGRRPKNIYQKYIKLYKPHGSINWKLVNGNLYRINNINFGEPCIITPGSNKYEKGYEIPFDYHIGKMGQEIDNAKRLIFIGYGFNDNHLETHLKKSNNISKPKLIVTRTLSDNAKKVVKNYPNTIAIEKNTDVFQEKGTIIHTQNNFLEIKNKDLWDISELIKEVF